MSKLTEGVCPCCGEHHLEYECDYCDNTWTDKWCSIVDDDCPDCGRAYTPEVTDEEEIEEAVYEQ